MAYYRGDYYQGDYYRGDPSFLGSIGRGLVGAVSGFVTGGPLGAVSGAVRGVLNRPAAAAAPLVSPGPVPAFTASAGGSTAVVRSAQGQIVMGTGKGAGGCSEKGYHLNKSGYFRRTPTGGVAYIEARSACVRNRRMNPANGRALRKALSRAYAFKRFAMKAIRLTAPKKKFGGFKPAKRKRS